VTARGPECDDRRQAGGCEGSASALAARRVSEMPRQARIADQRQAVRRPERASSWGAAVLVVLVKAESKAATMAKPANSWPLVAGPSQAILITPSSTCARPGAEIARGLPIGCRPPG